MIELATEKLCVLARFRQVYSWFSRVYKVNYAIGVAGYVAAVVQGMTGPLSQFVLDWSILAVFYGLYFGVLGRDIAEVCAERMSTTLGVSRGRPVLHTSCSLPPLTSHRVCSIATKRTTTARTTRLPPIFAVCAVTP